MLRKLNIIFISILALTLGINYCLYSWLSYEILGLSGELFQKARIVWGITQCVLGLAMLILIVLKLKISSWYKYWTIISAVVFASQLPMASLWYMMLMREPLLAVGGVILHTLLIALISIDYLYSHKTNDLIKHEEKTATFEE